MKYRIVRASNLSELTGSVNELITQGWVPLGAAFIDPPDPNRYLTSGHWYQTMTKDE